MGANEIIISEGPHADFRVVLLETLMEAGIPGPIVPRDREWQFATVFGGHHKRAIEVVEDMVFRCKVCLQCQAILKPGKTECRRCGAAADPCNPGEIRAAYYADWE